VFTDPVGGGGGDTQRHRLFFDITSSIKLYGINNFSIACIRYCRNVFTALGDTHTDTQTDGGIYKVLGRDGPKWRDIHTRFLKDWLKNLKVTGGWGAYTWRHTADSKVIS
jgi:hypothetical protein